jgi:hypothetical protein
LVTFRGPRRDEDTTTATTRKTKTGRRTRRRKGSEDKKEEDENDDEKDKDEKQVVVRRRRTRKMIRTRRMTSRVPTSGTATKASSSTVMTRFTQNSHRRNVKYDATTEPKCDSISLMRSSQGISTFTRLANSRFINCHL